MGGTHGAATEAAEGSVGVKAAARLGACQDKAVSGHISEPRGGS